MQNFEEERFHSKINKALEQVKLILDNTKHSQYAATDVHHEYEDKYILGEFLISSGIAAILNVFRGGFGMNMKQIEEINKWALNRNVTLSFRAEETCKFIKKVEREVKSDTKSVTKTTVLFNFIIIIILLLNNFFK
jgi:hypothetical protein